MGEKGFDSGCGWVGIVWDEANETTLFQVSTQSPASANVEP